ncbi:hypothetical protein ABNE06_13925 [Paenibacillus larvae]
MKRIRISWEWMIVLASSIVMIYILLIKPVIGVADNGDFLRLMSSVGLGNANPNATFEELYFRFIHTQFDYGPINGFYSTFHTVLAFLIVQAARLLHPSYFDIRYLGAAYAILFAVTLYLIMKYYKQGSAAANMTLALCLFFIFTDIGYVAYFNSFFGEPVSFISLLAIMGLTGYLTVKERPSLAALIFLYVSMLVLSGAKIQNTPIGIVLGLLGFHFMSLRDDRLWKRTAAALSALVIAGSACLYVFASSDLKHINIYQTVFYGVLKDSPNPEKDLESLGLPPELAVNAGTNYFQTDAAIPQNDPQMKQKFYGKVSHFNVGWYYLTHPGRLLNKLERGVENGMTIRPYYLGNYEQSEHKNPGELSHTFQFWSEFKDKVLPRSLWLLTLFYVLYYAVLIRYRLMAYTAAEKIRLEMLMSVGFIGIIALLVPLIGDGEADLQKHLFLFNVTLDIMLTVSLVWIVYRIAKRFIRNRNPYS